MDFSLFLMHLTDYYNRHKFSLCLHARIQKLRDEVGEVDEALETRDREKLIEEVCDVIIVGFSILLAMRVVNPLYHCYMKLMKSDKKYTEKRGKSNENARIEGVSDLRRPG